MHLQSEIKNKASRYARAPSACASRFVSLVESHKTRGPNENENSVKGREWISVDRDITPGSHYEAGAKLLREECRCAFVREESKENKKH